MAPNPLLLTSWTIIPEVVQVMESDNKQPEVTEWCEQEESSGGIKRAEQFRREGVVSFAGARIASRSGDREYRFSPLDLRTRGAVTHWERR